MRRAAPPTVIADAVLRAATARRPRARYVAPSSMRVPLLLSRLLPDRAVDAVARRYFAS
jgi:hypothetical protein